MGLFTRKKKKVVEVDIDKELNIIQDFINKVDPDIIVLKKIINQMSKLRQKKKAIKSKEHISHDLKKELQQQIRQWDEILLKYKYFEDDVDITGYRIKKISKALTKRAEELKLGEGWVRKMKTDEKWTFDW